MNKVILKYEPDLDFILIAISTSLKDYKLCFRINKQLNIQFYRVDELSLQLIQNEYPSYYSRYEYVPQQGSTEFCLLANKGTNGHLVPEMRTTDYFILIKNFIDPEDLNNFISGLNKIAEVQVAAEVDVKRLKSKENLIF